VRANLFAWRGHEIAADGAGDVEVLLDEDSQRESFAILGRRVSTEDLGGSALRRRVGERLAVGKQSLGLHALEQLAVELRWRQWRGIAGARERSELQEKKREKMFTHAGILDACGAAVRASNTFIARL
jgi:hypothetical protein